jgi:hypothetical protein
VDVGGVIVRAFAENGWSDAVSAVNVPSVGGPPCTRSVIVFVADPKFPNAACVAVMVAVPTEIGINWVPEIVATAGFEVVKDQAPEEFDVGGISVT